jgi:Phytanoyl-CoA dioxygenase (PhyH).
MYKKFLGPIVDSVKSENENARYYRKLPDTEFNKDGLLIIDNFLSEGDCDLLAELGKKTIDSHSKSGLISDEVYLNIRSDAEDGKDTKVKQIFNFDKLSENLGEGFMKKLSETFETNLGEEVVIKTCTLQIDDPDTKTKRSWHTDKNPPPNFKAFIYLTDVENENQGPYCAIKGSHRWKYRRILNVIYNLIINSPEINGYASHGRK